MATETAIGSRYGRQKEQAAVMHGARLQYKPTIMRRWVEEGNPGIEITGIRWLLTEAGRLEGHFHEIPGRDG